MLIKTDFFAFLSAINYQCCWGLQKVPYPLVYLDWFFCPPYLIFSNLQPDIFFLACIKCWTNFVPWLHNPLAPFDWFFCLPGFIAPWNYPLKSWVKMQYLGEANFKAVRLNCFRVLIFQEKFSKGRGKYYRMALGRQYKDVRNLLQTLWKLFYNYRNIQHTLKMSTEVQYKLYIFIIPLLPQYGSNEHNRNNSCLLVVRMTFFKYYLL